ncbi:helix-turn-helix transcriptional regulator [Mangrovimonas sp. AS39]|uniref:helix-turn-helix transcriptional regulator n=1 Tax=Mangrovimonas futianensis TaxID=2895523 RepID=UPI001E28E577|nr:helix-turn-helix transcriptional regulator [Mangrovimonas futianensis]MCF1190785.1 helix-turn-helix transcriptional regulator [Mangrovimonas futianensis]MCF1194482.1 helix-turn-helix transcriptional regulator [Mangrovimonas futianensis]
MDFNSIINFFLIAGVLQAFVFNLITWLSKSNVHKVVFYLNLTVLFIALNNLQAWITYHGVFNNVFFLKQMLVPWHVFILPAFFSFLRYFLQVEDKVKTFMRFTVIVFMVQVFIRVCLIIYVKNNDGLVDENLIAKYTVIEDVFTLSFSLFVFYKSSVLVFKRQDDYRNILSFDDISWIKLFLKLGSLIMLFWMLAKVFDIFFGDKSLYSLLKLSSSVLLYWIGYHGLYRFNVVKDRMKLRQNLAEKGNSIRMNLVTADLSEKHEQEFQKVNNFIVDNQKYLDPNLTMNGLAQDLEMSSSHLSKLVNTYGNNNFSDYINALRVEQSKEFLGDPAFKNYTIISIGLECGFNSKSTFYSAFKKFTAMTPSEYQNSISV